MVNPCLVKTKPWISWSVAGSSAVPVVGPLENPAIRHAGRGVVGDGDGKPRRAAGETHKRLAAGYPI